MSTKHEHKSVFTADNKDFNRKSQQVESRTKKLQNVMMKFGGALAAAFSVQKIVQFFSTSVKAYDKQIQAEKKLESAVRANGEAVESTMIEYKRWASEMQQVSTVGDETTLDMLAVAQSMGVTGESAKTAVKEAISLAKAMGMNEQSAIRYTAALADGNSTMLARYLPGLRSIEGEAARTAKAHELLGNMFSQVTEEAKQGLGPAKQLGNAFGDMKEEVGEMIVNTDAFKGSMTGLKEVVEDATDALAAFNELMASDYIQEQASWIERVSWQLAKHTKAGKENIKMMNEGIKRQELLNDYKEAAAGSVERYQVMIKMLTMDLKKLEDQESDEAIALQESIAQYERAIEIKKEDDKVTVNQLQTIGDYEDAIKGLQDSLKNVKIGHTDEAAAIKEKIKAYEELIAKTLEAAIVRAPKMDNIKGTAEVDVTTGPLGIDTSQLDTMKEQNFTLGEMKQRYLDLAEGYSVFERAVIEGNVMAAESTSELTSYIENLDNGMLAMQSSALEFGQAMVASSQMGISSLKDYAKYAVQVAKKIISAKIAEGVAGAVSNALKDVPFPFNLAAAGIAGGAAAALFNSIIPNFAEGGAVSGPTLALVGEAAGISSSNPEYIGTARQLAQMGAGGGRGQLTARISKGDLLFILNEGEKYNNNSF
jgi:uncharacterized protein YktA (UPF0223 family)